MVNKTGKNADKGRKNAYKNRKNVDIKSIGEVAYQATSQYGLVTANEYFELRDLAQEAADSGHTNGRP